MRHTTFHGHIHFASRPAIPQAGPPFRLGKCSRGRPVVVDRCGEEVGLLGDAWRILAELATHEKWAETQIAYVSRTDMPSAWLGGAGAKRVKER